MYYIYVAVITVIVVVVAFLVFKFKSNASRVDSGNFSGNFNFGESDVLPEDIGPIVMRVEDVFNISGRGIVVTGTVKDERLNVNDFVYILDEMGNVIETNVVVKQIEKSHKLVDSAEPGEKVGAFLDILNADKGFLRKGLFLKKQH